MKDKTDKKIITENRKARYDYTILNSYEAGISLEGHEVKSLRTGKANLRDSYVRIENQEAFLHNAHISAYSPARLTDYNPLKKRKLLLHKSEITKLLGKVQERGLTIVPLRMYFIKGKAKIEIALARGKHVYDKREVLRKRAIDRDTSRALSGRR